MPYLTPAILILLLAGILSACAAPTSTQPLPGAATVPAGGDRAQIVQVIDGDTVDVTWNGQTRRVRYIGVDAPERDEPFYREATNANRRLVLGQEVVLRRDVSETDQYGRLLRYVYRSDGTFVNAALLEQGYARVVTFPPDVAEQVLFVRLQREARAQRRGLWAQSDLLALPPGCETCDANVHDCRDFATQRDAQLCFEACLAAGGKDVHHLDGGGDGIVCESLP